MSDGIRDSGFGIRIPDPSRIPKPNRIPNPKSRIPALVIATVLGIGYIRIAPGTFGSAAGLLVWAIMPSSALVQGVAIAVLFVIGAWSGSIAEEHFGTTDPRQVVIDEVMGMLITLFLNPVGRAGAAGAFLLFRLADIVKPFPANRLERLPGGIGVMADDGMAAIYANLALRLILAVAA
ncbi:MAG: phosphatidylglycerophosphatase A [Acidobacteria bacterium]|nr:MAG: phosphatidylglycerophosphatase A [Acidobacteriota bacterium]PYR10527.1 MAG: phosphatidylglycerophosphatase A [Acidobacteriota bacterium]